MNKVKVSFPNLDGVRAIAAWMVVFAHIWASQIFDFKNITSIDLAPLGAIAVSIFFTLSGFLITYLLLTEKQSFQKISLSAFYLRRILRIWPLYFLVLLSGFLLNYESISWKGFFLSLFFMPNIAFVLNLVPYIIDPIWSIGVEEQFYIFHPLIVQRAKKNLIFIFIFLVLLMISLKIGTIFFHGNAANFLKDLLYVTRFDNMFIGAIAACMLYSVNQQQATFKWLTNKSIGILSVVVFGFYILCIIIFKVPVVHQLLAIFVGIILIQISFDNHRAIFLQNNFMKFNGKISYGIYLLHRFPLVFSMYVAQKMGWQNTLLGIASMLIFTIIFSVIMATLSYNYFENYFLKKKHLYSKISRE